jgi:hypothetical protein
MLHPTEYSYGKVWLQVLKKQWLPSEIRKNPESTAPGNDGLNIVSF